jgi:hypothetical protein
MDANTVKHTLRQLLATVHRDLPGAVFERRIAEARDQAVGIASDRRLNGKRRGLFVKHQLASGARKHVILHAVADMRMPAR